MNLLEKLAPHESPELVQLMDLNRIIALRKACGFTQDTLAKSIGIPRAYVIGWESGKRSIPAGLCSFFALTYSKFSQPWGAEVANSAFLFVDAVTVFSEWVCPNRLDLRYYVAQTKAKLTLDSADREMQVEFGIFSSNKEVAEPTGDHPQTIAQAEELLRAKGFTLAAEYENLTPAEKEREMEGAKIDFAKLFNKIKK